MKNILTTLSIIFAAICAAALLSAQALAPAQVRANILATAHKLLGVGYVMGGSSEAGFDCSGYVKYVYEKNGIRLPRTAPAQYLKGAKIPIEKARPADLVFFDVYKQGVSHVGIYLGDMKFIHAPSPGGRVSIAVIDQYYWKDKLVGAAAFLEEPAPQKDPKKP
ncbi:MAG: NlpC/P60 family protein [Spirochaetes bacterium]|nr:MAG: NlpC/P60 family protein [Spirochaetota bacterium]